MSAKSELRWLLIGLLSIVGHGYNAFAAHDPAFRVMYIAMVLAWAAIVLVACDRLRWFVGLVLRCFIGRL